MNRTNNHSDCSENSYNRTRWLFGKKKFLSVEFQILIALRLIKKKWNSVVYWPVIIESQKKWGYYKNNKDFEGS